MCVVGGAGSAEQRANHKYHPGETNSTSLDRRAQHPASCAQQATGMAWRGANVFTPEYRYRYCSAADDQREPGSRLTRRVVSGPDRLGAVWGQSTTNHRPPPSPAFPEREQRSLFNASPTKQVFRRGKHTRGATGSDATGIPYFGRTALSSIQPVPLTSPLFSLPCRNPSRPNMPLTPDIGIQWPPAEKGATSGSGAQGNPFPLPGTDENNIRLGLSSMYRWQACSAFYPPPPPPRPRPENTSITVTTL